MEGVTAFSLTEALARSRRFASFACLASIAWSSAGIARPEPLPLIGAAPEFSLKTQDEQSLNLRALRGKVFALTFIFTQCSSTCPILTAKLVDVQRKLAVGSDRDIHFVAITLTPLHDSPRELKRYAQAFGADPARWSLLTGDEQQIHRLARQYGVWLKKRGGSSDIDHAFLTSLIDRRGMIRVQYIGTRFDSDELLADLRLLNNEARAP
jgi:protein SCO1